MDDLARRIRDAGTALLGLRAPLVAAEPWPLSETWGTEPEADWGPREVLAHVDEMLTYWQGQLEDVVGGDGTAPVPFGRVASDADRLRRIGALREETTGDLLDAIERDLDAVATFVEGLSPDEAARPGLHPLRGELPVRESVERFFANHLEEHVEQLRSILDRRAA